MAVGSTAAVRQTRSGTHGCRRRSLGTTRRPQYAAPAISSRSYTAQAAHSPYVTALRMSELLPQQPARLLEVRVIRWPGQEVGQREQVQPRADPLPTGRQHAAAGHESGTEPVKVRGRVPLGEAQHV